MDEVIGEFLMESRENLDQLDQDLVALEAQPDSRDLLGSVFRTVHTVKGTCGFLGYQKLESVTHEGENLLGKLRDGILHLTPTRTTALLELVDAMRAILTSIETSGEEGNGDYTALVALLVGMQSDIEVSDVSEQAPLAEPEVTAAPSVVATNVHEPVPAPRPFVPVATAAAPAVAAPSPIEAPATTHGHTPDALVRVDVTVLDNLMNVVGELVLARNAILQLGSQIDNSAFAGASQRLNLLTTELQEGVMKTRMQPIGNVWSKFPRVVRDLSLQLGKQVRLEMEGADTELDRTILEAIKDPLTHIVRNTIDHGIESPERRAELGKPAEGVLRLRAAHEGGQVVIEVRDDGAGLAIDRIKSKAVERGLLTEDQATRMPDREAMSLIFLPGFSTAEVVTNVSGRGVGMDVVRTNIERIGGTVDVTSELGRSTTFRVKIPLTLAIIPVLVVGIAGHKFAIPQVNLLELVRLEGDNLRSSIEHVHNAPVFRLRGRLLPLVDTSTEFGLAAPGADLGRDERTSVNIVVLHADEHRFGLIVDEVFDTEEIVVKPLGAQVGDVQLFSGATIMGDGSVALIVDVVALATKASAIDEADGEADASTDAQAESDASNQSFLVARCGTDRRIAVDLDMVTRLEELDRSDVETSANGLVVQYRQTIMRLFSMSSVLGLQASSNDSARLSIIVFERGNEIVGMIVDEILDIVDDQVSVTPSDAQHVHGTAVIEGRVTDLIDIEGVLTRLEIRATGALQGAAV